MNKKITRTLRTVVSKDESGERKYPGVSMHVVKTLEKEFHPNAEYEECDILYACSVEDFLTVAYEKP